MMYFILLLLSFGIKIVCGFNGVTARQFRNEKVDVCEYVYVTNNSSVLCCADHDIQKDGNWKVKCNKRLFYQEAQYLTEENFEMSLSTRIIENMFLNIFLCDKENIFLSNCYWFSVSNFNNGGKAEIRKCHQDFIFINYYKKSRNECKLLRNLMQQYINGELSTNKFKLYKHGNYMGLVKVNGMKEILLMGYYGKKISNIKFALIYSEDDKIGIWQIDKIEYEVTIRFQREDMLLGHLNPLLNRSFSTSRQKKRDEYYIHKDPLKKNEQETINTVNGILNHHSLLEDFRRKKREFIDTRNILKIEDINTRSVTGKFFNINESVVVEITCLSAWCDKPLRTVRNTSDVTEHLSILFEIDNLQPFTQYNIAFKRCQEQENCTENVITKQFTTKPAAPHPVKQLEAYSKDENSISLRWKPPYPPTGDLARYKISYGTPSQGPTTELRQITELSKGFEIQSCHLWSELHCYTLSDLKSEKEYKITVSAKNKNPKEYGQSSEDISVITRKEPSDAPYDLLVEWTVESNLILKWKHPNISNGIIQRFDIILSPIDDESKTINKVLNISKSILQYSYIIDSKELLPSVDYKISIRAYNGFNGKVLIVYATSPPKVSLLDYDPNPEIVGKTIVLELSSKMLKQEKLQNYKLFVLISKDKTKKSTNILNTSESFRQNLTCTCEEHLRILKFVPLYNCTFKDSVNFKFNIGKNDEIASCDKISNYFVDPDKESYNIIAILTNTHTGCRVYSWSVSNSKGTQSEIVVSSIVVVVLLIILIGLFIYRKKIGLKCYFSSTHLHLQLTISKYKTVEAEEIGLTQNTFQDSSQSQSNMNGILERQNDNLVKNNKNNKMTSIFSKPVEIDKFEKHIKKLDSDGGFDKQFAMFVSEATKTIYETMDEFYDYIDMEFIDGIKISKSYIVTEIPKNNDVGKFWKHVWEDNVEHIVLLGEMGLRKGDQYWPEQNERLTYQKLLIELIYTKEFQFITYRKFILVINDIVKQVDQIHFSYSGLNPHKYSPFFRKISKLPLNSSSPILVHSSIGLGGVGFVLLCDMCLRTAEREKLIDVVGFIRKLRIYKSGMIRNVEQYKLVHQVILFILQGCKFNLELEDHYVNF